MRFLICTTIYPLVLGCDIASNALLLGQGEPTEKSESPRDRNRASAPSFANSFGMRFVRIDPGEFVMGTHDLGKDLPIPVGFETHRVRITKPYWLSVTEVTQEQFEQVMGTNPSWHSKLADAGDSISDRSTDNYPVENVTWHEAVEFCERLSVRSEEKKANRKYRLPTEAEWEFACRERTSKPYQFEAGRNEVTGESAGQFEEEDSLPVTEVASYPPNSLGLFDMRGNVWEWTSDWFSPNYYANSPRDNPQGPAHGMLKVVRGSDWVFVGERCNYPRDPLEPWRSSRFVGFRVLCEIATKD